ncbi:MAG: hypothetical protein PHG06_00245 [Parabacteroides sp.]|nr:hypothetical protein [Parabacteroides sp.]
MTAADRAKHIRTELKAMFPRTKFSIRSSSYSMGTDVHIKWTDGPTEEAVQNVIECLTEDLKRSYDIDLDTQYNGISLTRNISDEAWNLVKQEVLKTFENHPCINEASFIDRKISYELEDRQFL